MTYHEMTVLVDRYFKNDLNPEDVEKVLQWFTTAEGLEYSKAQLDKDSELLENETLFISPVSIKSNEMLNNIFTTIEKEDMPHTLKEPAKLIEPSFINMVPKNRRNYFWYKSGVVAAVLTIFFFTYSYYAGRPVSRSTNYGETARIILPDSSSVTLNGNSCIEYSANWNSTEARKVKLTGEAFFSVRHKANNQKFIVKTADTIQIEVLGTEFNVSGRKRQTQVVLVSGKIRLAMQHRNHPSNSVMMKSGELVKIIPNNYKLQKQHTNPAVITSWMGNKLIFEDTSVREICELLSDTYGYKINISDQKILNQRITGSVHNQSINETLDGLEAILHVKFTKPN